MIGRLASRPAPKPLLGVAALHWPRPAPGRAGSMPPPCLPLAQMEKFASFEQWKEAQQ